MEPVTFQDQLFAEFDEVVDLSVENEPERPVLVRHRLAAIIREVDDRKSPVDQSDRPVNPGALAVRATVGEPFRHLREQLERPAPCRQDRYWPAIPHIMVKVGTGGLKACEGGHLRNSLSGNETMKNRGFLRSTIF